MGPASLQRLRSTFFAVCLAASALLQCSDGRAVVLERLSVEAERYYQEEGEYAGDFEHPEESYEEEMNRALEKAMGPQAVLLLSFMTGRMVVATEDGLRSDGTMMDPTAQFESKAASYNSITLSTIISGQKNLLGIDAGGQIVLDAANSSDVVHEFEVVKRDEYEEDLGMVQLRAKVGSSYCYLAFGSDNLLVHKTCNSEPSAKKPTVETFFSIMPV